MPCVMFDFLSQPLFAPLELAPVFLPLALFIALSTNQNKFPMRLKTRVLISSAALLLILAFWVYPNYVSSKKDLEHFKAAISSGEAKAVSGEVRDFKTNRYRVGKREVTDESFTLAPLGERFQYSQRSGSLGFHKPGVIHEGMKLKITHLAGVILKIENESGCAPAY